MEQETCRRVMVRDILGKKALEIQLPNTRVTFPSDLDLQSAAVNALFHFNHGTYNSTTELTFTVHM